MKGTAIKRSKMSIAPVTCAETIVLLNLASRRCLVRSMFAVVKNLLVLIVMKSPWEVTLFSKLFTPVYKINYSLNEINIFA